MRKSPNSGAPEISPILEMIAGHGAVADVLAAICRYLSDSNAAPAVAFFVLHDERWILAAYDESARLANGDGEIISQMLAPDATGGESCERGWGRYLHSAAGELLGMVVALCDGPAMLCGSFAARVEDGCRLAVIAIEQNHLMTEVAFRPQSCGDAVTVATDLAPEVSYQQVARMIAQLRPPGEVLTSLCGYLRAADANCHPAFFLVNNDDWTLAAKTGMNASSEDLLSRIDPAWLSDSLLNDMSAAHVRECPTPFGWARQLCSETGELLGMLVGIVDIPALPRGDFAARIESACRLASLAIEQSNLIEELQFQARHDAVSGLFNRTFYARALASILDERRGPDHSVALLYVNLDRFRMVNDILGLSVGTRLLKHVGARFRQCLRPNDMLARVGGDEFALILPDVESQDLVRAIADRLLLSLSRPFHIDGHELFLTASMGVACSEPASTAESLERNAYLALYHAKRAGKARIMFFHPGMSATPPERLEMEKRLRGALERNEMVLFYQPQVHLASNRICGAEVLLRWRQDGFGLVSPGVFIPVLEETGLIVEVGRWVLREACRQGKQWLEQTGLRIRLGVNVSAVQFADPNFIASVREILEETGFPPNLLELELTESLMVEESGGASHALWALAEMGIQLALDDFGTGHSCLSYLHRLPFDRLKIDQSFVRIIGEEEECPALVEDIIRMADNLGMATIAEGIETPRQAEMLRKHGCGEGQGYHFSRPVPAEEFVSFYRRYSSRDLEPAQPEALQLEFHR